MVIGVEGNVHVGKTTYIKKYLNKNPLIPEIKFQPLLNAYDRQINYIEEETKRIKYLKDNSVLDRTIISTIIYTMYTDDLTNKEKKDLLDIITNNFNNNKIIIPSTIYLIVYPYKCIWESQKELGNIKKTQKVLVDYDYYLKYSMFFSNRYHTLNKIISTKENRQVIAYNKEIFNNVMEYKSFNSKVIIDGCPAIGKSTIGSSQKKYNYIKEFHYQKYTLKNYTNQINSIVSRINILNEQNILIDTSFLMGITHLFYNQNTSKDFKLKVIDEIMSKIPLNNYVTKIIYLTLDKKEIIKRKNKDKNKLRMHFYDNLQYLDAEINFYKVLNKRLGSISNIHFIKASFDALTLIKNIEKISDKPLLLVDLFYEIKRGIIEGEL